MSENREVSISDESSLKRKESNVELKTDQKFLEFKTALTEEGHVEQKGSVMSYVAKDFMEKLKTQGIYWILMQWYYLSLLLCIFS